MCVLQENSSKLRIAINCPVKVHTIAGISVTSSKHAIKQVIIIVRPQVNGAGGADGAPAATTVVAVTALVEGYAMDRVNAIQEKASNLEGATARNAALNSLIDGH